MFSRDGENALSPYCAEERRLEGQAVPDQATAVEPGKTVGLEDGGQDR